MMKLTKQQTDRLMSDDFATKKPTVYTINGKQYSEFDINKRCAELMGVILAYGNITGTLSMYNYDTGECYNPCNNWNDAGQIIEKRWDELMSDFDLENDYLVPKWEYIMDKHNCSKLVAACICLIEVNDEKETN